MNILIVPPNDLITNVLPNRLYHLAKFWSRRHEILLLRYPNYPTSGNVERELRHTPITFKAKPASDPGRYYIINAINIYNALKKTFEENDVDVIVHANILPSAIAVKLAKKYGIKTVFDYLDHYPESASAYYSNKLVKWTVHNVVKTITDYNLKRSDEVVTVSYYLRELLERVTGKKVHLIPNGVDTELFKPIPMNEARKRLGLEERDPIILYYGSIAEWIDYSLLLRLAARLRGKYPNLLLLMVGNIHTKADKARIIKLTQELRLENTIKIYPPQPQERMPLFISAANAVVAPFKMFSKNYVTPMKLLETLACKVPIFIPGMDEFKKWLPSYPFIYTSEAELELKIQKTLSSPDDVMEALQDVHEYVIRAFSWQSLAETYERLLGGVA